ncbi:hypothetical protein DFH06DRAFT_1195693 [Mycena polygramma]|nr:hypothetical protein DFH06DRAFT_1195693 [Mycena polygramma]
MSLTAQNPVRSAWGALQSNQSVSLQIGLRTDDSVVQALFAQRNARGRHHGRQSYAPSRLSSRPRTNTHQAEHDNLQLAFNEAKINWFRADQHALGAQQDIATFVEAQERWVRAHIGPSPVHADAAAWFVGGYAALFASWSLVSLRMRAIGGVGPRQFAVIAEENIPPQTTLHELTGLLSSSPADGRSHTNLSVMYDLDGERRVLMGPIRMLNHSCNPNTDFLFLKSGNGHAVTVRANRQIQKDEEITVSYGRQFWTAGNHCLCPFCVPPDAVTVPQTTVSCEIRPQKTRSAGRHTRRRANIARAKIRQEEVIEPSPLPRYRSTTPAPSSIPPRSESPPPPYQDVPLPEVELPALSPLPHPKRGGKADRKRAREATDPDDQDPEDGGRMKKKKAPIEIPRGQDTDGIDTRRRSSRQSARRTGVRNPQKKIAIKPGKPKYKGWVELLSDGSSESDAF